MGGYSDPGQFAAIVVDWSSSAGVVSESLPPFAGSPDDSLGHDAIPGLPVRSPVSTHLEVAAVLDRRWNRHGRRDSVPPGMERILRCVLDFHSWCSRRVCFYPLDWQGPKTISPRSSIRRAGTSNR